MTPSIDQNPLLVALSDLYPSDLQTGDVVPCDPIARAFEEKDGSDVMFWEKFGLAGFHFA